MANLKSLTKSKPLRIASVGVGGVVVLGAAASFAQSLLSPQPGVIQACADKQGRLRLKDANGCDRSETELQWNQVGPIGPIGPIGPQGPAGPIGPNGAQGPQGPEGAHGLAGPAGAIGPSGAPGRDGRDGRDGTSSGSGGGSDTACTPSVSPSSDLFVRVEGIPGESADAKHKDEIDALAFGWGGVSVPSLAGGGLPTGKAQIGPICFLKPVDKASTGLIEAATRQKVLLSVDVTFRKAGKDQQEYYKLKLEEVFVSSIKPVGTNTLPGEQVTMVFQRGTIDYCPQRPDGTLGPCNRVVLEQPK